MTISKHPIRPHMTRQIPDQFSWIDHRLVRDRHIDHLSHQAAALYLFLVTVGDARGLSYYGAKTLEKRLNMDAVELEQACEMLVRHGLVAYRDPLYQVLALDQRRDVASGTDNPCSLAEILQKAMGGAP